MRVSPGLGTEVAEDMPSIHTTAAHLDPRTYAYPYGHLRDAHFSVYKSSATTQSDSYTLHGPLFYRTPPPGLGAVSH